MTKQLTLTEVELTKLESTIEKGLQTFVEVGNALERIRLSKAYKLLRGFKTFAEYVKARFGLSKARGYALIEAAKVAEQIAAQTGHVVETAAEAERLGKIMKQLPAETLKATMQAVVGDDKKTARLLETTARNAREALAEGQQEANRHKAISAANDILENSNDPFRVEEADFREFLESLEPQSVDLILTDIDYHSDKGEYAEPLSRLAKRVLKPDTGMLAVMLGVMTFDKFYGGLCSNMPYRSMICYQLPEGKSPTNHVFMWNPFWKPTVVLGASPDYVHKDIVETDIIKADTCEKQFIAMQQDILGFKRLIELLIRPGSRGGNAPGLTIVDCFAGSGTTLVAGLLAKSGPFKVLGCDIDKNCVEVARARCKTVWNMMKEYRDGDKVFELLKQQERELAKEAA